MSYTKRIKTFIRTNSYNQTTTDHPQIVQLTKDIITHIWQTDKTITHVMVINNLVKFIHPSDTDWMINIKKHSDKSIQKPLRRKLKANNDIKLLMNSLVESVSDPDSESDDEVGMMMKEMDIEAEYGIRISLDGYQQPREKVKKLVFHKEEPFGPFGTDWIHHPQKDDEWGPVHRKRADTYDRLRAVIVPEQRTPEWFAMRKGRITASDGAAVIGWNDYEPPFMFLLKKVFDMPFDGWKNCYHGKKYEETATMVYQYRLNVKVEEFGMMAHPVIPILGASPDGIVCHYKMDGEHKTKFVGRMLEIKCPVGRKINMDAKEIYNPKNSHKGVCPRYYWVQVQQQLECCDLDECDFWQAKIVEYPNRDLFMKDTNPDEQFRSARTGFEKGVVIQLLPRSRLVEASASKEAYDQVVWESATFIYPTKIEMSPSDCDRWVMEQMEILDSYHTISGEDEDDEYPPEEQERRKKIRSYKDVVFDKVFYWRMERSKNVTITRDSEWFHKTFPLYQKMWNRVEFYRENEMQANLFKEYIDTQKASIMHGKSSRYWFKYTKKLIKQNMEVLDRLMDVKDPEYNKYVGIVKDWIAEYKEIVDGGHNAERGLEDKIFETKCMFKF